MEYKCEGSQKQIQQIILFNSMSAALKQIKEAVKQRKDEGNTLQLNLQGIKFEKFTPEINEAIEEMTDLQVLILIDCGLKTLEGFPDVNPQAIDLSNNDLTDDSRLNILSSRDKLTQVFLVSNKIEKLQTILALKPLKNLVQVDFSENPVSSQSNYRDEIFKHFPEMSVVDRKDRDGKEVEDEQEFEDDGDEDDEDEDEYEAEDDSEQFDEQDEYEEQSEQKKPKRGRKRKN